MAEGVHACTQARNFVDTYKVPYSLWFTFFKLKYNDSSELGPQFQFRAAPSFVMHNLLCTKVSVIPSIANCPWVRWNMVYIISVLYLYPWNVLVCKLTWYFRFIFSFTFFKLRTTALSNCNILLASPSRVQPKHWKDWHMRKWYWKDTLLVLSISWRHTHT